MALKLATVCLYCNQPFYQGDHTYCVKRLRHLQLVKGQKQVAAQIRYLTGPRYKRAAVKTCHCGETYRHPTKRECYAHSERWRRQYGPLMPLSVKKEGVNKAEDGMKKEVP